MKRFFFSKAIIYWLPFLLLVSCCKLDENSKRYSAHRLNKQLEGNWEVIDYQIEGVSYLDTLLKIQSPYNWNCKYFTFTNWKGHKGTEGNIGVKKGDFVGGCEDFSAYPRASTKYTFQVSKKKMFLHGPYFVDPIHFNTYTENFNWFKVEKLEQNLLILSSEKTGKTRRIILLKK